MTDAFDADVLIYSADPTHPLGHGVGTLLQDNAERGNASVGSVLLLPELLSKPLREDRGDELVTLLEVLAGLELLPVDVVTAELAASLGASYRLRAADAVHLATAINAGADRFISNNSRDFTDAITEIAVVSPHELA